MPHLLFPKHWLTLAGVGAAIVNALFRVLLIPLLLTPLVDKVLIQQEMSLLPRLLLWAGVAVLLGSLALWLQDGCLGNLAAWVLKRWRAGLYQDWLEPSPTSATTATEAFSSGGFSSRVLADLKEVEIFLQYGIGSLLAESLTLLGILAVLFYLHASATITLLLSLIPVILLMMWTGRALQRHSEATQAGLEKLGAHLQEGFSRRTLLQIFQAQAFALQRFDLHNQQTYQQQQRRVWLAALQTPLAQVLGFFALLLLLGRLLTSDLSAGELMSYLTLLALLSTPAQLLPRAYGYLQMARAAAKRLHTLKSVQSKKSYAFDKPAESHTSHELKSVDVEESYASHEAESDEFKKPSNLDKLHELKSDETEKFYASNKSDEFDKSEKSYKFDAFPQSPESYEAKSDNVEKSFEPDESDNVGKSSKSTEFHDSQEVKSHEFDIADTSHTDDETKKSYASYNHETSEGIRQIRLESLSFSYDAKVIVDDVSLELSAPSFVLITGESGAGKSTLLQLLLQLLEPTQGAIYFDAISPLSPEKRAQHIGYVPQTPQLFQASIADNLRLGRDFSQADLWQVLEQVGLQSAISSLAQGLATTLQEATSTAQVGLSVGQQQRLSLARALLHRPSILLLDEANANLDAASERQMLEVLRDYAQQQLVIMVSHRPLAREYADVVYQLEAGRCIPSFPL